MVTAELQVQAWYYTFQVIQVFLVTALSSSATAFIPTVISNPHHVPQLLADNLPKSSNFYLTYFILQGLACSCSPRFTPGPPDRDLAEEHFGSSW